MTDQPALFAAPKWADRYHVGQHIHDGVRDGIVADIITCPAAIDDVAVVLRYPDGHETSFGFGHTLSKISDDILLDASEAPADCPAGAPSAGGSGAGAPADSAPATDAARTAALVPASSHPKAITSGAVTGDGLSELDSSAGAIPGEAQGSEERDRAGASRMTSSANTAVTNEEAPALSPQPGA